MLRSLIVAALVMLGACSNDADQGSTQQSVEELVGEVKRLQGEIASIRDAVEDIHRTTVIDAGNGAPGGGPNISFALEDDDPIIGSANAQYAIVEFTDFQCPYCKRFDDQAFAEIRKKYVETGKLRYVSRDFPLDFHKQAKSAAVAANCARAQGRFWEMREGLFENARALSSSMYNQLASDMNLDIPKFQTCLADVAMQQEVERDMSDALALGLTGTPSFFVGRIDGQRVVEARRIVGAQSFSFFDTVVSGLLKEGS